MICSVIVDSSLLPHIDNSWHSFLVCFVIMFIDVVLVWRKGIWKKTVTVLCTVISDAQRYKQFLQVGRLYRSLVLLGLALCLPSASVSSVFMVLYIYVYIYIYIYIFK